MSVEKTTIVKKSSKAYGYNYACLADIVNAGIELPKMRLSEDGDFIEYKDEQGEWQRGARIVIPEMKGSNEAQRYGAALEYARRYTTMLAKQVCSSDDKKIEKAAPAEDKKLDFDEIREHLKGLTNEFAIAQYSKEVARKYPAPTEKQRYAIQTMFSNRRAEISTRVA